MGVPVNQIPNAPNAIPGAAGLPTTPIPGGAKMYDAPTLNSPNYDRALSVISRTSRLLDAPTPQPIEFIDYAAGAWADLGATGAKVASQMMDFAVQMQRTKDEGNIAKIDNMMAKSYGDFVTWSQDKQPDELLPEWNKRQQALMKEFGGMTFSQTGFAKASTLVDNKMIGYGVDVATTARKLQIKNADAELVAQKERYLMQGNYGEANAVDARRHALGFINNGELQQNLNESDKDQQLATLESMTAGDPFGAYEWLQSNRGPDGKIPGFDLVDAYAVNSKIEKARSLKMQKQRDAITLISDETLKNPGKFNEDMIRQAGDLARLPQENIDALVNNWAVKYDATPEGQAKFTQMQNDIFFQVRKFQPEVDPANGEMTDASFARYLELDSLIRRTMPSGHVERFTGPLNRAVDKARKASEGKVDGAQEIVRNQLLDQVSTMRKSGGLGDDGDTDKEGKPKDYTKFLKVEQAEAELTIAVEDIFKKNPGISAPEAFKQFQDLFNTGPYKDLPAREFFKEKDNRWFWQKWDWLGAAVNPMGNNPNLVTAGISFGPLTEGLVESQDEPLPPVGGPARPSATPPQPKIKADGSIDPMPDSAFYSEAPKGSKITSYNFKDDAYTDSNSRAGIGSFTKKDKAGNIVPGTGLSEEGMAVSPDVERKFREVGIKPLDWVQLELEDGTTIVKQWQNRTMQDAQAVRKYGKPLTGRFDFYRRRDQDAHPMSGQSVVAFSLAEPQQ